MKILIFVVCILFIQFTNAIYHHDRRNKNTFGAADTGVFWHVTDLHWDPTYRDGQLGWSCNDQSKPPGGYYGDYACDSPIQLIHSAIEAMQDIQPNPDFIVWTGDDTPHIWNDTILNPEVVLQIIFNQSDILKEYFPDTMVYSALGNHDWSPKSHLPPNNDPRYEEIAGHWKDWLNTEAQETFKKGGYYSMRIEGTNLTAVILNTNFYYKSNPLTEHMPDPANQLQWFDDKLTEAKLANEKVIVIGHVPPGMFEKHKDYSWFYPIFNELFLALLTKHQDTIGSIHFGHHHTDTFRVLYYGDEPVTSMFLAPAVAPWETTLDGVMGGKGNNPSVRLVLYDRNTGVALDIHQYYLNLTKANQAEKAEWELEYQGTALYSQPDMGTQSLHNVAEELMDNDDVFGRYYRANGVLYDPDEKWDHETRAVHYCSMTKLRYEEYAECYGVYSVVAGGPPRVTLNSVHVILCVLIAWGMIQ